MNDLGDFDHVLPNSDGDFLLDTERSFGRLFDVEGAKLVIKNSSVQCALKECSDKRVMDGGFNGAHRVVGLESQSVDGVGEFDRHGVFGRIDRIESE